MSHTLYLIRHGATESTAGHRVCGATDVALSERGLKEMEAVARYFSGKELSRVFSSPLQRARLPAAALAALERHGLSYDLLFYAKHLRHAPTVAAHCPGLRLVLDHLSKPPIALGWGHPKQEAWRRELRAAAAHPNLHAKLSGLVTEADPARWTVEDLAPFVRFAIDCFGPERVMFGSDWPVCLLASGYGRWVEAFAQVIAPLAPAERAAIWGGNAARFYRLGKA